MKVDDFLSKSVPGQLTIQEVLALAEAGKGPNVLEAQPEHVTSLTPRGIEVYYSWTPRRHYRLRWAGTDAYKAGVSPQNDVGWEEVPSVTTVLDVLNKPALPWWGMKVGVEGVVELFARSQLLQADDLTFSILGPTQEPVSADDIVGLLTQNKLTVNHVKDSASKRGLSVHAAFESWASDQTYRADPKAFEENERGYIEGLNLFLDDIKEGGVTDVEAEVMVGSVVHGFAGRFDVRYKLQDECEVTTRVYPKKAAKREVIPAGRYLKDVKSSKNVYPSHALQLSGYELASVEDGYEPTDYRAVIHLTNDGRYELVRTYATADDFLSILAAHNTMSKSKGWT